jgi:5-methylcytosine-specific restriction endonuclease McrA
VRTHLALYGNEGIQRALCPECEEWSFVIDGEIVCCDIPIQKKPKKTKRISDVHFKRRKPSPLIQRKILEDQDYCCLYCDVNVYGYTYKKERPVKVRLNWDHMVPYIYSGNNKEDNFAAACHVCNGIKSDMMFETIDDARLYILTVRRKKGYSNFPPEDL